MKKITKKSTFAEILKENPEAAEVLMKEGMHCFSCPMAAMETFEKGCCAHGLDADKILEKIKKKKEKR